MGVRQTLAITAALAALVAVVAGCASSSESGPARTPGPTSTSGPPQPLTEKTFTPYNGENAPLVEVSARQDGSCWTGSIAVPDPAAYRCLAGNKILDPCFAPAHDTAPKSVMCMTDPWSAAREVRLTEPLPAHGPLFGPQDRYWALELVTGAHCVAVTGTVPEISGVPMEYVCGSGQAAGALRRAGGTLVARFGSLTGSTLADVAVKVAWRG